MRRDDVAAALEADSLAEDAGLMLRWARGVVDGVREAPADEPDPALVEALVAHLVDHADDGALAWLAEGQSKALVKPARAGLHRLRSRGVEVARPKGGATLGSGIDASPPPPSLLSVYDGRDQRLVWLAEVLDRGLRLVQARVSARSGLLEIHSGPIGRKAYRKLLYDVRESLLAVNVSADVARWFIADAATRAEQAGRGAPAGYRAMALAPSTLEEHPALSMAREAADSAKDAGADDASTGAPRAEALLALYDAPELRAWLPERDEAERLMLRHQEVATSPLFVDQQQRQAQYAHTTERWLESYFGEQRRRETARQLLLDTAHVMFVRARAGAGKGEAARPAAASVALGHAALVAAELFTGDDIEAISHHPFVRHFIERVIPVPPAPATGIDGGPGGGFGGPAGAGGTPGGIIVPGR